MLTYEGFLEHSTKFHLSRIYCLPCVIVEASWALDGFLASVLYHGSWHLTHLALYFLDPWLPLPTPVTWVFTRNRTCCSLAAF